MAKLPLHEPYIPLEGLGDVHGVVGADEEAPATADALRQSRPRSPRRMQTPLLQLQGIALDFDRLLGADPDAEAAVVAELLVDEELLEGDEVGGGGLLLLEEEGRRT